MLRAVGIVVEVQAKPSRGSLACANVFCSVSGLEEIVVNLHNQWSPGMRLFGLSVQLNAIWRRQAPSSSDFGRARLIVAIADVTNMQPSGPVLADPIWKINQGARWKCNARPLTG